MTNPNHPLLEVKDLSVTYRLGLHKLKAVQSVSFAIRPGETLGLVGESGCGKSTLGKAILRLVQPTSGHIYFDGREITHCKEKKLRREMQIIFQDPLASLNPRMSIGEIIKEPLQVHKMPQQMETVYQLLDLVGLPKLSVSRYPHEFSGGQRQRIGIARALALKPRFLVCDEPISALDISIQAQIINLLQDLQKELHLTYLFIAHDLSMVRYLSTHVAVMYLGELVEIGPAEEVYKNPFHPYTQLLLSSIPLLDPIQERKRIPIALSGEIPSPLHPPSGCVFSTRCPMATELCKKQKPTLQKNIDNRQTACHYFKKNG
jgi:oligopeptide transport system ATP-binding protein